MKNRLLSKIMLLSQKSLASVKMMKERTAGTFGLVKKQTQLDLTKTQREIMPLVLRGDSSEEIAGKMASKKATISAHLFAIYRNNESLVSGKISGAKVAWLWLNENYSLVPKLQDWESEIDARKIYLVELTSGVVSAKKTRNGWRCALSGNRIPADEVTAVCELNRYEPFEEAVQ